MQRKPPADAAMSADLELDVVSCYVNDLRTAIAIFRVDVAWRVCVYGATLPYCTQLIFVTAVANMFRTHVNLYPLLTS